MKYLYYLNLSGYDTLALKICSTNTEDLHTNSLNRFGIEFEGDDYLTIEIADNWAETNGVEYLYIENSYYSERGCKNFHENGWKLVTYDISEEATSITPADGPFQYLEYETYDWYYDLTELRLIRDKLLLQSDITRLDDYPISASLKSLYAEYREYLRDRPDMIDDGDPHCLDFDVWKIIYWDPFN